MIIAITGIQGQGQTFLDWSILYLNGATRYWREDGEGYHRWRPLSDSPLNSNSAHGHKKGHPGITRQWREEYKAYIDLARQQENEFPIILYPFPDPFVGIDWRSDLEDSAHLLKKLGTKVIWITQTEWYPFGHERAKTVNIYDYVKISMASDNLPSDRKIRKFLSLNLFKQKNDAVKMYSGLVQDLEGVVDMIITDRQIQYHTHETVKMIMDKLGLTIVDDRWKKWCDIASQWQKTFDKIKTLHTKTIPGIAKAIVENREIEWPTAQMDIFQESMVMYWIMKNHRKQLVLPDDDFPYDSKYLHKFLRG